MKVTELTHRCALALAMSGILVSQSGLAWAADPAPAAAMNRPAAAIGDVALAQGGVLHGQVLSKEGVGQAGAVVSVLQGGQRLAQATTDRDGRFAAQGLKGGVYVVATDRAAGVVRAWAPRTAPPSAAPAVMLVPDGETLRGQDGALLYQLLSNPGVWIVGGAMGAVLALAIEEAS